MDVPLLDASINSEGCRRGELILTNEEANKLNTWLSTVATGTTRWRFSALPDLNRRSLLAHIAAPPRPAFRPGVGKGKKSDHNEPHPPVSKMKDWAQHFHRSLLQLMQQEIARPFVDGLPHKTEAAYPSSKNRKPGEQHLTRNSAGAQNQREIYQHIQPYLDVTNLSLRSILQRLESGGYPHALEVFNDLYCYFLAGYRHYPPASSHWIRLYQCTTNFFSLMSALPLKDDFNAPPSVIQMEEPKVHHKRDSPSKLPSSKPHKRKSRPPSSSATKTQATAGAPTPNQPPKEPPVKNRERRNFQKLLQALPPELHRELYETFSEKGVWKEQQAGQIELDESNTSASVFREMMGWCAARVSCRKRARSKETADPFVKRRRSSGLDESEVADVAQQDGLAIPQPVSNNMEWSSSGSEGESSSSSSGDSGSEDGEEVQEGE